MRPTRSGRSGSSTAGSWRSPERSALEILDAIEDRNDQKEFYLTDAVEVANAQGLKAVAVEIDADEVFGINDRAQLARGGALVPGGAAARRRCSQARR